MQQRLPKCRFRDRAEDDGKDRRRHRIVEHPHEEAAKADKHHQPDIEHVHIGGVCADKREHENQRDKDAERHAQHPQEQRNKGDVHQNSDEVRDIEGADQRPDEIRLRREQERSGLEPPDDHAGKQHRRGRRARDAKRHHRQHRACRSGVVGGLRRRDAVDGALAIGIAVTRRHLGDAVSHQRGRRRAGRRKDADKETDHRADERAAPCLAEPDQRVCHAGETDLDPGHRRLAARGVHRPQHFRNAVNADGQNKETDAVREALNVEEDQPRLAGDDVEADSGQRQAETDGKDCLREIIPAKPGKGREGQQHQGEYFRIAEIERHRGQHRRETGEHHVGHGRPGK